MLKSVVTLMSLALSAASLPAFASASEYEYALCSPRNPVMGEYNFLNILGAGPQGAVRQNGVTGVLFSAEGDLLQEKLVLTTRQLYVAEGPRYSRPGYTALVSRPGNGDSVIIENFVTGRVRKFALDAIFVPSLSSGNDSITIRYIDLDDELQTFTTSGCFFVNQDLITRAPSIQY